VVSKGFQEVRIPMKSDVPSRDIRTSKVYVYNVRWKRKLILFSPIVAIKNDVYQQKIIMKD
jgi:hypothetical protein